MTAIDTAATDIVRARVLGPDLDPVTAQSALNPQNILARGKNERKVRVRMRRWMSPR